MNPDRPEIVERSLIHRGKRFDFEMLTVRRSSGAELRREVVRHPGAVVVVPILEDGQGKTVVLIRNFRIAVLEPLLECCAGTIERPRRPDERGQPRGFGEGESPEVCAARELVEETGYRAARLHALGWFYTTPGLTDERMFAFAATGLTHVGQKLEEDEQIEVEVVPASRAMEMVRDGEIRDAKTMLALLLAERAGMLSE